MWRMKRSWGWESAGGMLNILIISEESDLKKTALRDLSDVYHHHLADRETRNP